MSEVIVTIENEVVLVDDGECRIELVKDIQMGNGTFGLCTINGGGFSMTFMTKQCWDKMKNLVDKFIEEELK